MKAIAIEQFGGLDELKILDLPRPEPAADEVLIRVHAAGVNPVDWKIREGYLKDMFPHEFPLIPGWDVAGVVETVGAEVSDRTPGDAVYAYARKEVVKEGAYAEYTTLKADVAARKPESLDFKRSAAIPLAGLTAWQALFNVAKLDESDRLLVHAAAGGVGSFAVQLAKHAGAEVWGTASPNHHSYLWDIGVDHVVDYRSQDFREAVGDGVDVVFDLIGGDTLGQSAEAIAPKGRIVSIVDPDLCEQLRNDGVDARFHFVEPNAEQLRQLADLADRGILRPRLEHALPLEAAEKAHQLSEQGHVCGKIVLKVIDD